MVIITSDKNISTTFPTCTLFFPNGLFTASTDYLPPPDLLFLPLFLTISIFQG